ncbi:hypothetical protein RUM43_011776, partial [Polyplax serrata]
MYMYPELLHSRKVIARVDEFLINGILDSEKGTIFFICPLGWGGGKDIECSTSEFHFIILNKRTHWWAALLDRNKLCSADCNTPGPSIIEKVY